MSNVDERPRPTLGGISRVVARLETVANKQESTVDAGLADLESMKKNANELKDLISTLKRGGGSPELSEMDELLSEYGLFNAGNEITQSDKSESSIAPHVSAAVQAADGVILVHDLFCLINRKMKLERIYSPREFLSELYRIPSVSMVKVLGYTVIVSLKLNEINSRLLKCLQEKDGRSDSEVSEILGIRNLVVLRLLLIKAEENYGQVVRDDSIEGTHWYLNAFK